MELLRKLFQTSFIIVLTLAISGCVGTIQKNEEDITKSKNYNDYGITFEGIDDVVAVAHNKVDVSFFPAGGGSGVFTYVVYKDGDFNVPVASIPDVAANLDAEGKFHVPVGNLSRGTTYTFAVRAYDIINDVEDTNTKTLSVTTLGYEVPIFDGIVALENVGGADGETKLKIRWNVAQPSSASSDPFGANPNAISGYNVYLGASPDTMVLAGSVTDPASTSFIVTNLNPGTNYFAKVRAKNSASPVQEDLNEKYLQRSTLLSQPIVFSGIKTIAIPSSSLGYSNINITWDQGSGSFDRYRVFVATSPIAAFDPATDSTSIPDITDLSSTSFTVSTGVSANTMHYVAVVACKGGTCSEYAGHNIIKSIKTTPPVATFNGIENVTQPSDASGLSSLILTWSPPDISVGVFNEIKIFKVDNATGIYNELVDEVPAYDAGSPSTPGFDPGQTTTTRTVIKGLQTGTEYCFIAKAYATSPFDSENPNGRTHVNEKKMCGTPVYSSPGFSGIGSTCTAVTSSSFTVSWDTPNPMGIFDRFNIWLMSSSAGTFDFDDAISGDPSYILRLATKDKTTLNVSGLSPNTTYKIGARTYFYDSVSATEKYDGNIVVATCGTLPAKVEHNGWFEITALGRKMNGLSNPPTPIVEKLRAPASPYSHTFPEEAPLGSVGVDASDQGIIRVAWEDFTLTGGLGRIFDYPGPTNGYRVYRKEYQSTHDQLPPSVIDNDWGAPLNADLISPKVTNVNGVVKYYAEFTDYTVTRPADPTETKMYWYKVEAILNNAPIAFNTLPSDGVVRVVLPPDNMALVHRWMANKDICSKMGKQVLRGDNYRCAYNGLASKNGYYDMENDLLVDRFELGCNFTRGYDLAKKCTSTDPNFEGSTTNPMNGIIEGDCIGNHSINMSTVYASNGSVFYEREGYCYINTSSGSGNTWTHVGNLQGDSVSNTTSTLPKNNPALYPGGTGYGAAYSSSNAKLPPLARLSRGAGFHTCAAHDVKHKGTQFNKRNLRRKEWVAAASWSSTNPGFATVESGTVESGALDRDCNTNTKGGGLAILDLNHSSYAHSNTYGGMISGSAGDFSTAACVSQYGIQDMVGNFKEITSEPAWYNYGNAQLGEPFIGTAFKGLDESTAEPMDDYLILDPEGLETLKTGTGEYLNFGDDGVGLGVLDDGGQTTFRPYSSSYTPYLSIPLGVPVACGIKDDFGNFYCDNQTDDNTLVTSQTSRPPAVVTNFPTGGDGWIIRYNYHARYQKKWEAGGYWADGAAAGQYHLMLYYHHGAAHAYQIHGNRCGTLIED